MRSKLLPQGKGWWKNADDPWQFLACAKELKAALKSGDPQAFMSDLPVHQDGTCNGLQHYAALGGDARGAQQVNLSVTDRPSDVYTFVAEMVQRAIERDVAKGNQYAIMLSGKIARKVVKQTVCLHFQAIEVASVLWCRFIGHDHCVPRHLYRRSRPDRASVQGLRRHATRGGVVYRCISR